ncbi:MAG TPA: hypothetical protein VL122_02855 [Nitrospirota bacterium]|nr:hypothetical protein [Nitrospirota bacterium]
MFDTMINASHFAGVDIGIVEVIVEVGAVIPGCSAGFGASCF